MNQIEKDRYLIPCKCLICNKHYKDLLLGSQHVYEDHTDREKKNVIENLSWDLQFDLKKWEILQQLIAKRDIIISKLSDIYAIEQASIPEVVEIQRKKANISEIMNALLRDLEKKEKTSEDKEIDEEIEDIEEEIDERDFESLETKEIKEQTSSKKEKDDEKSEAVKSTSSKVSKRRNLCELLEREVEKYVDAIKRLTMAEEVDKALSSKKKSQVKTYKLADQLDYFLGVAKAIKIIKESNADLEIII